MPVVAFVSPQELCRGSPTDALAKRMGPRDAPAAAPAGAGARAAGGGSGKQQADASAPPPVPVTPHGVTSSAAAAAAAALAARDQLLVAGATPESSFLALLVRDNRESFETEKRETDAISKRATTDRRRLDSFANLSTLSPSSLSFSSERRTRSTGRGGPPRVPPGLRHAPPARLGGGGSDREGAGRGPELPGPRERRRGARGGARSGRGRRRLFLPALAPALRPAGQARAPRRLGAAAGGAASRSRTRLGSAERPGAARRRRRRDAPRRL